MTDAAADDPGFVASPPRTPAPVAVHRTSLLALDMPLSWTWTMYVVVFLLVMRYTLFPWYRTWENPIPLFFSDVFVNTIAVVSAAFIHSLPYQAYRKARLLSDELDRERRIARTLYDRAFDLAGAKSRELHRVGLDKLYQAQFAELVAGYDRTAAARILRDVLARAQMLRFEPSGVLVRPYREELVARLPEIAKYQRISLQLGIMFTFFGLMLVFSGGTFSGAVTSGGDAANMAGQLITGLNLAFGGSVAGLISSIIVILFLDHLRRDLVAVIVLLEQLAEELTSVAHRAFDDPQLVDNLAKLEGAFQRAEGEFRQLQHQLGETNAANRALLASVDASTPKISEAASSIGASMAFVARQQQELVESITRAYERMTPTELGDRIFQALQKGLTETQRQLQATAGTISALHEAAGKIEAVHVRASLEAADMRRALMQIERDVSRLRSASAGKGGWRGWFRWLPIRRKPAELPPPAIPRADDDEPPAAA